jgi:hypothetical protein
MYQPWIDDVSSYTAASSYGKSVAPPLGMEGSRGPTLPNVYIEEAEMYAPITFPNPYGQQGLPQYYPQMQQPQMQHQQYYQDPGVYREDSYGSYATHGGQQANMGERGNSEDESVVSESVLSGRSSPILRARGGEWRGS